MYRLLFILYFVFTGSLYSQLGMKLLYVRPTGEMGMTFDPAFSGELVSKSKLEKSHVQYRTSISWLKFNARMKEFPVSGYIGSGVSTTVVPGSYEILKYNLGYVSVGVDYELKLIKNLFIYFGIDLVNGGINSSTKSNYPLILSEEVSGGDFYIGLKPRIGLEYRQKKFAIFFDATRNYNLVPKEYFFNYNDYGIGAKYFFEF